MISRRITRVLTVAVASLAAVSINAVAPGDAAAETAHWKVSAVPHAANYALWGVSCTTASSCTLVGWGPSRRGLALQYDGHAFTRQTLPAAKPGQVNALSAVACHTSSGTRTCMAVGQWDGATTNPHHPLAEQLRGHTWRRVPMPDVPGGTLRGVDCTSASWCVAVGEVDSGATAEQVVNYPTTRALVMVWNGKHWSRRTSPLPATARHAALFGIDCPRRGHCVIVGEADRTHALIAVLSRGHWRKHLVTAVKGQKARLTDAACTSMTRCEITGWYTLRSGATRGLLGAYNGTTWIRQAAGDPGTAMSTLSSISCGSATSCVAFGTAGTSLYVDLWNGHRWAVRMLPTAAGHPQALADTIYCSAPSRCVAVGQGIDGEVPIVAQERP